MPQLLKQLYWLMNKQITGTEQKAPKWNQIHIRIHYMINMGFQISVDRANKQHQNKWVAMLKKDTIEIHNTGQDKSQMYQRFKCKK